MVRTGGPLAIVVRSGIYVEVELDSWKLLSKLLQGVVSFHRAGQKQAWSYLSLLAYSWEKFPEPWSRAITIMSRKKLLTSGSCCLLHSTGQPLVLDACVLSQVQGMILCLPFISVCPRRVLRKTRDGKKKEEVEDMG